MDTVAMRMGGGLVDGLLAGNVMAFFVLMAAAAPLWFLAIDRIWFHYSRRKQGIPPEASMYRGAETINRLLESMQQRLDAHSKILGHITETHTIMVGIVKSNHAMTEDRHDLSERLLKDIERSIDRLYTEVRLNGDRTNQLLSRCVGR